MHDVSIDPFSTCQFGPPNAWWAGGVYRSPRGKAQATPLQCPSCLNGLGSRICRLGAWRVWDSGCKIGYEATTACQRNGAEGEYHRTPISPSGGRNLPPAFRGCALQVVQHKLRDQVCQEAGDERIPQLANYCLPQVLDEMTTWPVNFDPFL